MTKTKNNSALGVAEESPNKVETPSSEKISGAAEKRVSPLSVAANGATANGKNNHAVSNLNEDAPVKTPEITPETPPFSETEPKSEQLPVMAAETVPIDEIVVVKSPAKPENKAARRALSLTISSLVVLLTVIFAYRFFYAAKTPAETTAANPDRRTSGAAISLSPEQTRNIAVEIVQKRFVAGQVKSPGKVAFNSSQISSVLPQFSGRLTKLAAEVGQKVRAGQILGMIETPDIVQPQADFQQSLANERTVQTTLEHAVFNRERDERLAKVEAIPLRELQDAQVDEKHAREDLGRARQTIAAARSKLQSLHFADADIKTLESGGRVLSREVPLVAPIGGTIIERKAGLGQVVQPGGDALLQIADLSNVWVNAEVYEDRLARLRVGLPASVETPAYPNERFSARVDQIGSVVDADKRTVAVRCVLPNSGGKLKPGMFVNVSLGGVSNQEAVTVPATAVVTEGDKRAIFVETEPNHYEKREVTVGDEQEGTIIVKSGLKEGERVVVKGGLLVAAEGN